MESLPTEVGVYLCSYFSLDECQAVARVSKRIREWIFSLPEVWHRREMVIRLDFFHVMPEVRIRGHQWIPSVELLGRRNRVLVPVSCGKDLVKVLQYACSRGSDFFSIGLATGDAMRSCSFRYRISQSLRRTVISLPWFKDVMLGGEP